MLLLHQLSVAVFQQRDFLLTKAAAAPAAAKSGFPLAALGVTLGKAEPEIAAPLAALLMPALLCMPLIVECLLGAVMVDLIGELLGPSRFRTAVPFLKFVAGGSGSGRMPAGVAMEL